MQKASTPHYRTWDLDGASFAIGPDTFSGVSTASLSATGRLSIELAVDGFLGLIPATPGAFTATHNARRANAPRSWVTGLSSSFTEAAFTTILTLRPLTFSIGTEGLFHKAIYHLKNISFLGCIDFSMTHFDATLACVRAAAKERGAIEVTLTLTSAPAPTKAALDEAARTVCRCLSIAQRTRVSWPLAEYGDPVSFTDVVDQTIHHSPVLLIPRTEASLKAWLDLACSEYTLHDTSFGLSTMIEYFVRSAQEPTIEIRFTLLSVFMEAFKFAWAKNSSRLIQDRKRNGLIRGFKSSPDGRCLSFEELLTQAAAAVNYRPAGGFEFIDDRNALFHSGNSAAVQFGHSDTYAYLKAEMSKLSLHADSIILHMFGFSGKVIRWGDQENENAFP